MSDLFSAAMGLLLAEQAARTDVEQAGELLGRASSEGDARASERCAMFEAFGMARPQSWDRALDFLELGAAQGSVSAQQQLLLLADSSRDPEPPRAANPGFWKDVRNGVDIHGRMRANAKESLSDTPRIRIVRAFASAAECRWLVNMARPLLVPATTFDMTTGKLTLDEERDNTYVVLRIAEMNVFTEVIRNRISAATGIPVPLFEPSQLLHYSVGQRFKPHCDFLDPSNPAFAANLNRFGQRIATFLIYLNSSYEGGETTFPEIELSFRGNEGDALFFANVDRDGMPDPKTLHAGLPPRSGEKWVFSQWIRDRFPSG